VSTTIAQAIAVIEALSPLRLAADWDNCGLQVGDTAQALKGIAVAVDPTHAAIEEALGLGANLLVTHHPLLFKAPRRLDLNTEPGLSVAKAIRHGLTIYAAHTNLDATAVNHALAERLGLQGTRLLHQTGQQKVYKLGVFVPHTHIEAVREALWAVGAGVSDNYSRAGYQWETQEYFQPGARATPHTGAAGADTHMQAIRFECLITDSCVQDALQALHQSHPYDVPAYELIELQRMGVPEGWGLVGELAEPESLEDFARRVKHALGVSHVRYVGDRDRLIRQVAWLGGSGGDYFQEARRAGADVYITGEIRHHAALDGLACGLSFIEVGHIGSEQPVVPYLAAHLSQHLGANVPVFPLLQRDPFHVV